MMCDGLSFAIGSFVAAIENRTYDILFLKFGSFIQPTASRRHKCIMY